MEPESTPDGRYVIVGGRRWRASDPGIPGALRAELVAELMYARRLVRSDALAARPRVQDAKIALGERGDPWWEPTPVGAHHRACSTARALLRQRKGAPVRLAEIARVAIPSTMPDPDAVIAGVVTELLESAQAEARGDLLLPGTALGILPPSK